MAAKKSICVPLKLGVYLHVLRPRGAVLWFLVVLLYAALSAARLVAAEADEPCWPASATSPPLLGQSRRAPFTRRLTAFQCRAGH